MRVQTPFLSLMQMTRTNVQNQNKLLIWTTRIGMQAASHRPESNHDSDPDQSSDSGSGSDAQDSDAGSDDASSVKDSKLDPGTQPTNKKRLG